MKKNKTLLCTLATALSIMLMTQCTVTEHTITVQYQDAPSSRYAEFLETFDDLTNMLTALFLEVKNPDIHMGIQRNDLTLTIHINGENTEEIYQAVIQIMNDFNKALLVLNNEYNEPVFQTESIENHGCFSLTIIPTGLHDISRMKRFSKQLQTFAKSMQRTFDNTTCSLTDATENATETIYSGLDKTKNFVSKTAHTVSDFSKNTAQKTIETVQATPKTLRNAANSIGKVTSSAMAKTGEAWEGALENFYTSLETARSIIKKPFTRSNS